VAWIIAIPPTWTFSFPIVGGFHKAIEGQVNALDAGLDVLSGADEAIE
jgi:hypothetical protein